MNSFVLFFLMWNWIPLGGGQDYDDYYQLDYHRPRDRQIALQLQAKAVENQGKLILNFGAFFVRVGLLSSQNKTGKKLFL